jgi:hypothetical protein
MGEFVHRDTLNGAPFQKVPGNVRPWILGDNGAKGNYAIKVAEHGPNIEINRDIDGVHFNHLPMGSYHVGITVFLMADGSVHNISDSVDFDTYQAAATANGNENPSDLLY